MNSKVKIIILMIFSIYSFSYSQNIQTHYDFGNERKHLTLTFEMFKVDDYGSTFFFSDFNFNEKDNKSVSLSYFEVSRYFKIKDFDYFEPTIQFNDGIANFGSLGPIWLLGMKRNIPGTKINLELLYRRDVKSDNKDFQITATWFEAFGKFSFKGFLDIWSEGNSEKKFVILTEPQIWYNAWDELSIGSELEISNNFLPEKGIIINPTLALKWNFK